MHLLAVLVPVVGLLGGVLLLLHGGCQITLRSKPQPLFASPTSGGVASSEKSSEDDDDFRSKRKMLWTLGGGIAITAVMTCTLLLITHDSWLQGAVAPIEHLLRSLKGWAFKVLVVAAMWCLGASSLKKPLQLSTRKYALLLLGVAAAALAWEFLRSWATLDLMAAILAIRQMVALQPRFSFVRLWASLMILAALYDAVQVFMSGNMQKAASTTLGSMDPSGHGKGLALPFLFVTPAHLSWNGPISNALGLGDVLISGILLVAAGRAGQRAGCRQMYRSALAGCAIGLLCASVAAIYFHSGQPATIYLVPAIGGMTIWTARRHGHWDELFKKQYRLDSPEPPGPREAGQLLPAE